MDELKIFVCGNSNEEMDKIPNFPHLIKINLSQLNIGEFQNNQLAEHRIYLTDFAEKANANYVGFLTWRWFQKFNYLIELEKMNELKFSPNKVYCGWFEPKWLSVTSSYHPGMEKYLNELSAYTGLVLQEKPTFAANQFICHKSVYLNWQKFFRNVINNFHKKYGFNYDFYVIESYRNRIPAIFYERVSMLYFSNRLDLQLVQIPPKS